MPDIFLSYSSKDRPAADRVQRTLSALGMDVFWDQQVPPGTDWDTWTRGKLSASKIAIVLWSNHSVQSPSVRHEAMIAQKAGKLLPAMIDGLAPEDFPMGLYLVQTVKLADWASPDSKGMARLVGEVEGWLGRKTSSEAAILAAAPVQLKERHNRMLMMGAAGFVVAAAFGGWLLMQAPAAGSGVSGEKARQWNGVPGFEGIWVAEIQNNCIGFPWTFTPAGNRIHLNFYYPDLRYTTWEVVATSPQVLRRLPDADPRFPGGDTMTVETDGRIRYDGADGAAMCTIKREG
ncbi:MAG: toll/interleukin-1 receptor domain-containing protein [Hyphomonadaceae bacterium]|nr:toll/interleukin-1 receptor domain-containing protein [Hyphomonadaceae bacterium]